MNFKPGFFQILQLSGFPVRKAKGLYNSLMKIDDLEKWHLNQRDEILKFHLQNNPFYKRFVGEYSGSWEDLPIIKKSDLIGNSSSKLPDLPQKYYSLKTSGSSGHALTIARDRLTHVLVWLSVQNHYKKAGVNISDLQARFYGIPLTRSLYFKERFKDYLSNRVRFPVFDLSDGVLEQWLNSFRRKPFVYLYGYTNSLVAFASYLLKTGVVLSQVCPSLKACIVTAESCSDEDVQMLEGGFGLPIYNEYGATEVSVIGFQGKGDWEVSDELVYVEVVNDHGQIVPDGTIGRLLCTLLHNKGTPILRYEIGDMASIRRENGKTFITNLSGRLSDMVVFPSGRKVPGLTFYYVAKQLLSECEDIGEFRIVQTGITEFELELIAPEISVDSILPLVQKGFDKYLEPGLKVGVKNVASIERTGAGKFKHFIKLAEPSRTEI